MSVRILFQDLAHENGIQRECERFVGELQEEFPETFKYEVTLTHSRGEHETHVHVTGKDLEVAAHATERELGEAVIEAFDRVRKQLRKHRDKRTGRKRR